MTKDRGEELRAAVEAAELKLNYMWVFHQETGEEAVVQGMTLEQACERYPEWSYRYAEMVKDDAYYRWEDACREQEFWFKTKDMTDEEYEDYLDSLNDYDYALDDCYDY